MRMEDIVNKVFARSFLGYDMEQVDLFLDEIIERFEQYEADKKEMLLAMEYLLNKLEHDQQLPIMEMRKAIDTGKAQKKRLPTSARLNAPIVTETQPSKPSIRPEETKPARTIARGAQPPKPVRAPKISRVRVETELTEHEKPKEAVMTQKQPMNASEPTPGGDTQPREDAPAAVNWLDELLINLSERDKTAYDEPLKAAEQPNCNNGDLDPLAAEPKQTEEEELAEESELDSTAIEEEPR